MWGAAGVYLPTRLLLYLLLYIFVYTKRLGDGVWVGGYQWQTIFASGINDTGGK
jgi:hypothetical protein